MCLCRRNLIRPCYWNCGNCVFVQPCYSPLAAGQWNILPSVEFPRHGGIIETCQGTLRLGSLAHSRTERQLHIKVSSHTRTNTQSSHLESTAGPRKPQSLVFVCEYTHRIQNTFTHTHTLVCYCFSPQKKGQLPPDFFQPGDIYHTPSFWYHSARNNPLSLKSLVNYASISMPLNVVLIHLSQCTVQAI